MTTPKIATLALIASLVTIAAAPAQAGSVRARTGKGTAAAAGSVNGTSWARGRTARTDSDGSTTGISGGGFRGANGSSGARASTTTVNPDGSATRRGGFAAQGPRGSAASEGNATRNADGTYSGSRNSTATSAATGNSYNGATTYDTANGVSRTNTCTTAGGATIACPKRP